MEHVLVDTQATLGMTFSAGFADDDDPLMVTVYGPDGVTVVDGPQAATKDITVEGRYTYTLPPQPELTKLYVTWRGEWQDVVEQIVDITEIVGSYLFPISRLRSFGDKALKVTADYPDTALIRKRAEVSDFFEQVCKTSFILRYGESVLNGTGTKNLWLPNGRVKRLLSCSVGGSAIDVSGVTLMPSGQLVLPSGWANGLQNIAITYVYGYAQPPPKITEAGLVLARYELVNRDLSDRMIAMTSDLGTLRLSVPGRDFPTGLPVVDAALTRYDETVPLQA